MTGTLVYFTLLLKMSGVVKHDEIMQSARGLFPEPLILFFRLSRALAKCDESDVVLTGA